MTGLYQSAFIALGSNENSSWGDVRVTILKAMSELADLSQASMLESRLFGTPAFPAGAGPDFVNAVVSIQTTMSAPALLEAMHDIEHRAGRLRKTRWGQRTLDLDLIALGDLVLPDNATHARWRDLPPDAQALETPDQLILPHPRLQDRSFVLVPMADIAPDWVHPLLKTSVRDMLDARPAEERATVVPLP